MFSQLRRHGWRKATVSAVAAYALALQAFLTGFAGAAQAAPALLAEAGILCAEHGGSSGDPRTPAQEHQDGSCGILHCTGLGAPVGLPPAPFSVPARTILAAPLRLSVLVDVLIGPRAVKPVGSRAPPLSS